MANVLEPLKAAQKMQLTGESVVEAGSMETEYAVSGVAGADAGCAVEWHDRLIVRGCCSIKGCASARVVSQHMRETKTPMATIEIHGLAVHAAGAQLVPYRYDPGELKANEVEVRISHCGVCHSDIHLIDNDWGFSKYPFIPGHEIVGTVSARGR